MDIIQQVAREMVEKVFETIKNSGIGDIGRTIKELVPVVSGTVLNLVSIFIEEMDASLVSGAKRIRKEDGITIKERNVQRTILTELGELTYKRTYFKLSDGSYVYMLDHIIGIESYERISRELLADILQASTVKSYQQAVDSCGQSISRQTVHNRVVALDELAADVTRSDTTPETLDIFADEDHVHLSPKGSAIVPLVTITEGMDVSNPKRHKTVHPLHVAAFGMSADAFKENVLAVLTQRYDLDKVKRINLHADGGNWIQGLKDLLPNTQMVMDGFHLAKRMKSFFRLPGASRYAPSVHWAMKADDYDAFERYCTNVFRIQQTEAEREKVRDFVDYCARFWDSIVVRMRQEACGSCTEPLVSHVLSERLSRNPIAWSREGLSKMTMMVVYRKNGGRITADDVRVRADMETTAEFREDGYGKYRDYAKQQSDALLNSKHDWSLFEHECSDLGKVDGTYLIRKSLGSFTPLAGMVS